MNPQYKTMNPQYRDIIAIDVSKRTLQLQSSSQSLSLSNDASGFARIARMAARSGALVALEATGGYERPLLEALDRAKVPAAAINPARVRAYATSKGVKAKTDAIDARVLLDFARERRPDPREVPEATRQLAADLLDRRSQLVEHLSSEKARLDKCPKAIAASIRKIVRLLQSEIAAVEARIEKALAADAAAKADVEAMLRVQGVGKVTAWSAFAYLPDLPSISRNRLASLAGLAPFNRDSGTFTGKRSIAAGRRKVRRPLFMAATSARTHNAHIRAFYERLAGKGKPHKVAIVACMRKLLIHLQSVVRKAKLELV